MVVLHASSNRSEPAATPESEEDASFWKAYQHWKAAGAHGSFYGDEIGKAVEVIDPLWSKAWANHAALTRP